MVQTSQIKLHPSKPDTYYVSAKQIACDGGELGHPKVFLELGDNGSVICPYCSREFIYKK